MPEPSFNPTSPTESPATADPAGKPKIRHRDKEDAFLLYTIFLGDAVKTAHALDLPVSTIIAISEEEGWDKKVGQLAALRKSDKPGDLERAINRACNFAQAHRMRQELERVIDMIRSWGENELRDMLISTTVDKAGNAISHFSSRPLADLTASLEKAHMLTYLALGDTAQDRARRKEETDDSVLAASAMHSQIAKAMAEISISNSPRTALLEEQMRQVSKIVGKNPEPEPVVVNIPPIEPNEKTV